MSHTQDKSSAFAQGLLVFVYLAALTALEYFIAVTFNGVPILVLVAVVKAALVMYYYMHIYKLNEDGGDDHHSYAYKTVTNRIGLWLFLLSDAFVFGGLMTARINLLGLTRPHLNQILGLAVTAVLLISSFFMNRGETAMAHGDKKGFFTNTLITFCFGIWLFAWRGGRGMAPRRCRRSHSQQWGGGRGLLHDDGYARLPRLHRLALFAGGV